MKETNHVIHYLLEPNDPMLVPGQVRKTHGFAIAYIYVKKILKRSVLPHNNRVKVELVCDRVYPDEPMRYERIEYHGTYKGQYNWEGVGDIAYIPVYMVDLFGRAEAFERCTGIPAIHILSTHASHSIVNADIIEQNKDANLWIVEYTSLSKEITSCLPSSEQIAENV